MKFSRFEIYALAAALSLCTAAQDEPVPEDFVQGDAETLFSTEAEEAENADTPAVAENVDTDTPADTPAKEDDAEEAESLLRAVDDAESYRRRIKTRTFRLVYADAQAVADRFNATWDGNWGTNWKVKQIASAFPEANAVMVTAPQVILDACEGVVKEIDIEVPQVYIEARFVSLNNSVMHKLGIDWQSFEGMAGAASLEAGLDKRRLPKGVSSYESRSGSQYDYTQYNVSGQKANSSYFAGTLSLSDLSMVLSALERENDVRIFSNPKIIVSSGKKAVVDMTEKYPNVAVSAKRTTTSATANSLDLDMKLASIPGEDKFMFAKEAFFSWGISLEVTPRIGTNGLISVQIVPTISDCTDFVTAGAGAANSNNDSVPYSKYPILDVQRLVTEFSMASGTTAVIGGLSKTVEESVDSGIPWLRDIPWIGNKLFGDKSRQKVQKEILVFVSVGLASPSGMANDVGLPKNAILGREYTEGRRAEPGERRSSSGGLHSLDLRDLTEQQADPASTNTEARTSFIWPHGAF